jgi:hypothetical protein
MLCCFTIEQVPRKSPFLLRQLNAALVNIGVYTTLLRPLQAREQEIAFDFVQLVPELRSYVCCRVFRFA